MHFSNLRYSTVGAAYKLREHKFQPTQTDNISRRVKDGVVLKGKSDFIGGNIIFLICTLSLNWTNNVNYRRVYNQNFLVSASRSL
jgi:hypothetical protein